MKKPKFNVGDKVQLKKGLRIGNVYGGMTFYPSMIFRGPARIRHIGCAGNYSIRGYYYSPEMIELVNTEKIVIYRDKNEPSKVIAKNTATGKICVAKCNPADEFNFNTGAKLAFDRLMGTEPEPDKPKYYNGKVVCVKDAYGFFTVGKVYSVENGALSDDDGIEYRYMFLNINHINNTFESQFAELIE